MELLRRRRTTAQWEIKPRMNAYRIRAGCTVIFRSAQKSPRLSRGLWVYLSNNDYARRNLHRYRAIAAATSPIIPVATPGGRGTGMGSTGTPSKSPARVENELS